MSRHHRFGNKLRSVIRRADFLLFALVLVLGGVLAARYGPEAPVGEVEALAVASADDSAEISTRSEERRVGKEC